jgi:broad specificity phosphatase PhoE
MTKIILVRHGHVEGISPERFRGRADLALVGHDTVNRAILLHALGLPLSGYRRLGQGPCAINELDFSGDGFVVLSMNETSHLPPGRSVSGNPQGGDG